VRSVIFRFEDVGALSTALGDARGSLALPSGESVNDGEWVLAIFEIGSKKRATAAAARGHKAKSGNITLAFERRDWDRLVGFCAARSEHMRSANRTISVSSAKVPVAPVVRDSDAPPRSRRLDDLPPNSQLESSRVPFGARVLVVDGEGAAEADLQSVLSEMGLVVEHVGTLVRGEECIAKQVFDAVVLDLRSKGSDMRAFVGKIRAHARMADVPVLFLSSKPTSRDVVDAFACGGDDFLPKPFRTTELAARIFGLLRRASLARSAAGG
jgi:two-component system phosphate regulon response regulator PhoB